MPFAHADTLNKKRLNEQANGYKASLETKLRLFYIYVSLLCTAETMVVRENLSEVDVDEKKKKWELEYFKHYVLKYKFDAN
jgi:hypothetical protein